MVFSTPASPDWREGTLGELISVTMAIECLMLHQRLVKHEFDLRGEGTAHASAVPHSARPRDTGGTDTGGAVPANGLSRLAHRAPVGMSRRRVDRVNRKNLPLLHGVPITIRAPRVVPGAAARRPAVSEQGTPP